MPKIIVVWSKDNIDLLREMWASRKYTKPQIAEAIGGGCTLGAVVGKIDRLGLGRDDPAEVREAIQRARARGAETRRAKGDKQREISALALADQVVTAAAQPKPIFTPVCQPNPAFRQPKAPKCAAQDLPARRAELAAEGQALIAKVEASPVIPKSAPAVANRRPIPSAPGWEKDLYWHLRNPNNAYQAYQRA